MTKNKLALQASFKIFLLLKYPNSTLGHQYINVIRAQCDSAPLHMRMQVTLSCL